MNFNKPNDIIVENAKIMFRNFSGNPTQYTREGVRTFCLVIENPDDAQKLLEDGWNVKKLEATDDYNEPLYYISVKVNFTNIPPSVYIVKGRNKTLLDEESVSALDYATFSNIDLIVQPYCWEMNGKTGVSAYLKTGYFTIVQDRFADKYGDLEE